MTIGATVAACISGATKVATGVTQITDRPDPGAPRQVVVVDAGLTGLTVTQVVMAVPPPPVAFAAIRPPVSQLRCRRTTRRATKGTTRRRT